MESAASAGRIQAISAEEPEYAAGIEPGYSLIPSPGDVCRIGRALCAVGARLISGVVAGYPGPFEGCRVILPQIIETDVMAGLIIAKSPEEPEFILGVAPANRPDSRPGDVCWSGRALYSVGPRLIHRIAA